MAWASINLSWAAVRAEPTHRSEMVNSLLFGENVIQLETREEWTLVESAHDQYQGWVLNSQLQTEKNKITDSFLISIPVFMLPLQGAFWFIPCGAEIANGLLPEWEKHVSNQIIVQRPVFNLQRLLALATQFMGTPYLWGGRGYFGFDCSGFTQVLFKLNGIALKRDASQQQKQGQPIEFGNHIAGDLAFFQNINGVVTHVGIVANTNRIVHASGCVRLDELNEQGIYNAERNCLTHTLHSINRISSNPI